MTGELHQLMAVCWDCGQVFGSGIILGPGASFRGSGNMTVCPRCRHVVDIPDGEYAVVDGAVRWLRQFRDPEERAHLADVLREADARLRQGAAPEAVAAEIERATGLRVWDFLVSSQGGALAGWISMVLALIVYLSQPDAPAAPAAPAQTNITVVVENPPMPLAPPPPSDPSPIAGE